MAYTAVPPAFINEQTVTNSMCLRPGGEIGTCNYQRRAFNIITSGPLLERMQSTATAMQQCETSDHCVPEGNKLIGKTAPDGKRYTGCSVGERQNRLRNALSCAKRVLA